MHGRNLAKAAKLYESMDESGGFYTGHARSDCRSTMNVTFTCPTPELDTLFLSEAEDAGMRNLKGHRSIGGLRASIYNAFPVEGCEQLASFMNSFAARNG